MKIIILILFCALVLGACSKKQKDLANITKGMTKTEVISQVGEPDKKTDLLMADLWRYDEAGRTIVFRQDTVYDIMTSTDARLDSIENALKETGSDVEEKIKATGDTLDSAGRALKNKIFSDSARKN